LFFSTLFEVFFIYFNYNNLFISQKKTLLQKRKAKMVKGRGWGRAAFLVTTAIIVGACLYNDLLDAEEAIDEEQTTTDPEAAMERPTSKLPPVTLAPHMYERKVDAPVQSAVTPAIPSISSPAMAESFNQVCSPLFEITLEAQLS
jgi:hypothetical protein